MDIPLCSVEGCERKREGKYCSGHRRRLAKDGELGPARMNTDPNEIRVKGVVAEMDLYRRNLPVHTTIFDAEDIPKVEGRKWGFVTRSDRRFWGPYVHCQPGPQESRQSLYLHRLLTNCPKGMWVDHINGDTLDNRKANLRVCTPAQNVWNNRTRRDRQRKGVVVEPRTGRWVAQITRQFNTFEEAVAQREEWEKITYGEFATQE